MPRLFVGNFSFEEELARDRQELPAAVRRVNAEMATCWMAIVEAGDRIWCPAEVEPDYWSRIRSAGLPAVRAASVPAEIPTGLELVPWGWTKAVREFALAVQAVIEAPDQKAVRAANSRRFSHRWERDHDVGLEGAECIESLPQLEAALGRYADDREWVLKAEFSGAGRERRVGRGSACGETLRSWARRRLSTAQALFLEPWVERVAEAGIQWTIPRQGPPVLEGVVPLLTATSGQYRGSRFRGDDDVAGVWAEAVAAGRDVAIKLQEMGYFGPLGIDAARYRDAAGTVRLRPVQDVNARWTMGRLALGWRRLEAGQVWRHGPAGDAPGNPAHLKTSPLTVGGRPVQHVTWIE
jgi:hypothetical protein